MTAVIDYQYSAPLQAYTFPSRTPHTQPYQQPPKSSVMVKQHPQPLNLNNVMHGGGGNPYLQPITTPARQGTNLAPTQFQHTSRRTNSTSTAVTGVSLERSTSNASSGGSNAYVTRLRKQKATVWCDRAQREDARLLAAQKAAKARAALEVARAAAQRGGGSGPSSVHKGKIRHDRGSGKKGSASLDHEFSTNRSLVAGVPARVDIGDDNSDDDQPGSGSGSAYGGITRRTNSGRSSINSTSRRYAGSPQLQLRIQDSQFVGYNTNASSPSTYSRSSSIMDNAMPEVPEVVETPNTIVPDGPARARQEYFAHHTKSNSFNRPAIYPNQGMGGMSPQFPMQNDSFGSSSSGESRPSVVRNQSSREPGDLRRKGSIDESRTMTMGRVRLFVANPDE